jgi:hypothetical protein
MPWLAKALLLALKTRRGRELLFACGLGAVEIARSERARKLYGRALEVAADIRPRQNVVGFARTAASRVNRRTDRASETRPMLRTLRLRFADRPDYELAVESTAGEADPRELLDSRAGSDGRISLGDRESCTLDDVLEVTLVTPESVVGPTFEHDLQDEDVATALDENYDPPG